jgi:hypothetical protein
MKDQIPFTDGMWDSVRDNWWDKAEAIAHIPEAHLDKRREAF